MSFVARQALSVTRTASRSSRLLSSSSVLRKDFVQDMYLKELKVYKPAPKAANDHVGSVKEFSAPAPPQVPALPTDLASELARYDATEPVSAPSVTSAEGGHATSEATEADAFLSFLEADVPKEVHH
ncbi:ATP synthase complex subunit H-domain-containing protein [Thelephora terrestris]|uniref:ATP synthase complex subunit H-domain-containing protein n=1 Tax=Thelephora terrestris TaxID=56493 RepID=A0A9P6HP40_9AGAM|nr:ATP synthase complex subunit H-domain-containing protein [Thelephora terrestris]